MWAISGISLFVGLILGMIVMACCAAAGRSEDEQELYHIFEQRYRGRIEALQRLNTALMARIREYEEGCQDRWA